MFYNNRTIRLTKMATGQRVSIAPFPVIIPDDALYHNGEALTHMGEYITLQGATDMAELLALFPYFYNSVVLNPVITDAVAWQDVATLTVPAGVAPDGIYETKVSFTHVLPDLNDAFLWRVLVDGQPVQGLQQESKDVAEIHAWAYFVPTLFTGGAERVITLQARVENGGLDGNVLGANIVFERKLK